MRKRWIGGLMLVALVGVLWIFLQANHAKDLTDPARARQEGRPIPVRTGLVEEQEVDQVTGATAVTYPSFTSVIRIPPTGGLAVRYVPAVTDMVIKAIHIREGSYVKKGQLLFETDNEFFLQVLEQRKSAVAAAAAQLERAKQSVAYNQKVRRMELTSAESEVRFRTEDLNNRKKVFNTFAKLELTKATNLVEYYDAKSKHEQARFDLEEAKRRLEWAQDSLKIGPLQDNEELSRAVKEVDLAKIDLEETRRGVERSQITSPIDGFVDGKFDIVPGQTVEITTPLARVLQVDPIHVRADCPQERMDDVSVGQEAEVVLDSFPGETFRGRVIRSSAQVSAQLRTFPVIVELSNPQNRIRAGISGFVRLRKHRTVKTVPASAVIQHGGNAMVFRIEEGRARIREVRTGRIQEGGMVEVIDGLDRSDEVVVYFSNFYRHWGEVSRLDAYLQDNDLVDVNWRKWARRD
jgi:multidrug efflux pump subunit AcrA (membrane-fusion protein)